jgi:hypothetical protein
MTAGLVEIVGNSPAAACEEVVVVVADGIGNGRRGGEVEDMPT